MYIWNVQCPALNLVNFDFLTAYEPSGWGEPRPPTGCQQWAIGFWTLLLSPKELEWVTAGSGVISWKAFFFFPGSYKPGAVGQARPSGRQPRQVWQPDMCQQQSAGVQVSAQRPPYILCPLPATAVSTTGPHFAAKHRGQWPIQWQIIIQGGP